MAIAFARVEYGSRSKGDNACCKAAYNARGQVKDEATGKVYDFSDRKDNIHHEILLPEWVNERFKDKAILSNEVEASENRKNSQLFAEYVLALPKEESVSLEMMKEMVREFVKRQGWVEEGLAVQIDIHKPHDGGDNWHAHLARTVRIFEDCGNKLGAKARHLEPKVIKGVVVKEEEITLGMGWMDVMNEWSKLYGLDLRVNIPGKLVERRIGPKRMRTHLANKLEELNEEIKKDDVELLRQDGELLIRTTKHHAVFTRETLLFAARKIRDRGERNELVSKALLSKSVINLISKETGKATKYFTSKEIRDEEKSIWRLGHRVNQNIIPKESGFELRVKEHLGAMKDNYLTLEQRKATEGLLLSSGVSLLRGKAGTGKSRILNEVCNILTRENIDVIAIAPTHKAKSQFKNKNFAYVNTVKGMLFALKNNRMHIKPNSMVIVDEASMVSNACFSELFKALKRSESNVILTGDELQLGSVERGGIFAHFANHPDFESQILEKVNRQKNEWGKQVANAFAKGDAKYGLSILERLEYFHYDNSPAESASRLLEDWSHNDNLKSKLILTVKKKDVEILNEGARIYLIKHNLLGKDEVILGNKSYRQNERIIVTESNKGLNLRNGDFGILSKASKDKFTMKLDDGRKVEFDPNTYQGFTYGYASTIYKSQGESIKDVYLYHDNMGTRQGSYVGMSRHQLKVRFYANKQGAKSYEKLIDQLAFNLDHGSSLRFTSKQELAREKEDAEIANRGIFARMINKTKNTISNVRNILNDNISDPKYYHYILKEEELQEVEYKNNKATDLGDIRDKADHRNKAQLSKTGNHMSDKTDKNDKTDNSNKTNKIGKDYEYHIPNYSKENDILSAFGVKVNLTELTENPTLFRQITNGMAGQIGIAMLGKPNMEKSSKAILYWDNVKNGDEHSKHEQDQQNDSIILHIAKDGEGRYHNLTKNISGNNILNLVSEHFNCNVETAIEKFKIELVDKASQIEIAQILEELNKKEPDTSNIVSFTPNNTAKTNKTDNVAKTENTQELKLVISDKASNISNRSKFNKETAKQELYLKRKEEYNKIQASDLLRLKDMVKDRVADISTDILGEPNRKLSNSKALRFGSKGSIMVNISGARVGTYYDYETSEGGDMFKLAMKYQSHDFIGAKKYLEGKLGFIATEINQNHQNANANSNIRAVTQNKISEKRMAEIEESRKKEEIAATKEAAQKTRLVNNAIKGAKILTKDDVAYKYLKEHRNIELRLGESNKDIKTSNDLFKSLYPSFNIKSKREKYPALIVFARDAEDKITGGQYVLLDKTTNNKALIDSGPSKRSFGTISGSFVTLQAGSEENKATNRITIIAEGVETGLSLVEALKADEDDKNPNNQFQSIKVIASLGIGNIKNYLVEKNEKIIIAADNDGTNSSSDKIILNAKKTLEEKQAFIEIIRPTEKGDFNDILKSEGGENILEIIKPALEKHQATDLKTYLAANGKNLQDELSANSMKALEHLEQYNLPQNKIVDTYRQNITEAAIELDSTNKILHGAEMLYDRHATMEVPGKLLDEAGKCGWSISKNEMVTDIVELSESEPKNPYDLVETYAYNIRNNVLKEHVETNLNKFNVENKNHLDDKSEIGHLSPNAEGISIIADIKKNIDALHKQGITNYDDISKVCLESKDEIKIITDNLQKMVNQNRSDYLSPFRRTMSELKTLHPKYDQDNLVSILKGQSWDEQKQYVNNIFAKHAKEKIEPLFKHHIDERKNATNFTDFWSAVQKEQKTYRELHSQCRFAVYAIDKQNDNLKLSSLLLSADELHEKTSMNHVMIRINYAIKNDITTQDQVIKTLNDNQGNLKSCYETLNMKCELHEKKMSIITSSEIKAQKALSNVAEYHISDISDNAIKGNLDQFNKEKHQTQNLDQILNVIKKEDNFLSGIDLKNKNHLNDQLKERINISQNGESINIIDDIKQNLEVVDKQGITNYDDISKSLISSKNDIKTFSNDLQKMVNQNRSDYLSPFRRTISELKTLHPKYDQDNLVSILKGKSRNAQKQYVDNIFAKHAKEKIEPLFKHHIDERNNATNFTDFWSAVKQEQKTYRDLNSQYPFAVRAMDKQNDNLKLSQLIFSAHELHKKTNMNHVMTRINYAIQNDLTTQDQVMKTLNNNQGHLKSFYETLNMECKSHEKKMSVIKSLEIKTQKIEKNDEHNKQNEIKINREFGM